MLFQLYVEVITSLIIIYFDLNINLENIIALVNVKIRKKENIFF